jgi:ribosomal protein S6--L-glutamate ligase
LGIDSAFAKLDTGADTSSLHARDIVVSPSGNEVEFTAPFLRSQSDCRSWPGGGVRRVRAPLIDERIVRSASGEEVRRVIETELVLGSERFSARFSLTNREGLRFFLLIGRDALAGRFAIDPGRAHLLLP